MKEFEIKDGTHVVFKIKDIVSYTTEPHEKGINHELEEIHRKIAKGREESGRDPFPSYYVINKDEPYADEIFDVIRRGELAKPSSKEPEAADEPSKWKS